ncbi:unnamed protein product, partial [Meganyctiphanes norvegica]
MMSPYSSWSTMASRAARYTGLTPGLPPLTVSQHWSDLGTRARFDLREVPTGLVIESIGAEDEAEYRCRVDFKKSATRNVRVHLQVIVPPGRVSIIDDKGEVVSGLIGPYDEGVDLTLTCLAYGGSPRPLISWWHDGSPLDDVSEDVKSDHLTKNSLTLPNLGRQHLFRTLTCHVSNSKEVTALMAEVELDLNLPPVDVVMRGLASRALHEGETYSIVCESQGSRPAAQLSWWINNKKIYDNVTKVLNDASTQSLKLQPTRHDNGANLTCRAVNPQLPERPLEDSIKLEVYYAPNVTLRTGQNMDLTTIEEGDDVYFECDIDTNPRVGRVKWLLNNVELRHNLSMGIIQSNRSLVLQKVNRNSSGRYTCLAENIVDSVTSNQQHLHVKFAPVCAGGQKRLYGSDKHQPVNVTCTVEANPEANRFRWAFNTTNEMYDIPDNKTHSKIGHSLVAHTPHSHRDFGSLLCWAENKVGAQKEPCVFHVVPASVPDPVHQCNVSHNASAMGVVIVGCRPGWSGGLPQTFSLQVRLSIDGEELASLEDQKDPQFTITGLEPGTEYALIITAHNTQGASDADIMTFHTPIDVAEKQTSAIAAAPGEFVSWTVIVGILMGVIVSVTICSIAVVILVRTKLASQSHVNTETKVFYDKSAPDVSHNECGLSQEESGPDIILIKGGSSEEQLLMEYQGSCKKSFSRDAKLSEKDVSSLKNRYQDSSCDYGSITHATKSPNDPHVTSPWRDKSPLSTSRELLYHSSQAMEETSLLKEESLPPSKTTESLSIPKQQKSPVSSVI